MPKNRKSNGSELKIPASAVSKEKRESVKVRIITNQFVQTDAANFKSVVQRLTGRDSNATAAVAETGESSRISKKEESEEKACVGEEGACGSRARENVQSEELERGLSELPSFEELYGWWADH